MVSRGISDSMAFTYLGIGDANQSFQTMLEAAISDAEEERGYVVEDVQVTIEIDRGRTDIEDILQRFNKGEPLTESEMSTLLRSDEFELDQDALEEFLEQISQSVSEGMEGTDMNLDLESEDS